MAQVPHDLNDIEIKFIFVLIFLYRFSVKNMTEINWWVLHEGHLNLIIIHASAVLNLIFLSRQDFAMINLLINIDYWNSIEKFFFIIKS